MKLIPRNKLASVNRILIIACLAQLYSHPLYRNFEENFPIHSMSKGLPRIEKIDYGFERADHNNLMPSVEGNLAPNVRTVAQISFYKNAEINLSSFGWAGDFDLESRRLRDHIIAQFGGAASLPDARAILTASGFVCSDANSAEMRIFIPDNLARGTVSNATRPHTIILCHATRLRFIQQIVFTIYIQSQDATTVSNVDVAITSY